MTTLEAVDGFERSVLAANAPLAGLFESSAVAGAARMRELAARTTFPSWPGATSASKLRAAAHEAETFAILDEYAAAAQELLRPADVERWQALVVDAQRRAGRGVLTDELGCSTVGASLLRDRLGWRPFRSPQRSRIRCECGYAADGVLPKVLCDECEELLLRRWVAEERRLLRGMPAYAEEVALVIERTAEKQAKVFQTPGDDLYSEAFGQRKAGGRRLAKLGRTHRVELERLDLRRWSSFIAPFTSAARPSVKTTVAKVGRRGLGAAAITELVLCADEVSNRLSARILAERTGARRK
ncbi:hypothetical protein [Agromyces sp. Root81]|uniref:hypothetical protein n=1 Tax=Agromyces sp. Root81 TaxID=1736601 RepID=UPI0012F82DE4|nr:hypothetical protein [Agromyces sp. Root81]